jgi:hypothetical protein
MEGIRCFMNNGTDTKASLESMDERTMQRFLEAARQLDVDLDVVGVESWLDGMTIEMEHGLVNSLTNVTDDNAVKTAKIALAHILELPDYYASVGSAPIPPGASLREWEDAKMRRWRGMPKPQIINPNYWEQHTVNEVINNVRRFRDD